LLFVESVPQLTISCQSISDAIVVYSQKPYFHSTIFLLLQVQSHSKQAAIFSFPHIISCHLGSHFSERSNIFLDLILLIRFLLYFCLQSPCFPSTNSSVLIPFLIGKVFTGILLSAFISTMLAVSPFGLTPPDTLDLLIGLGQKNLT